MLFIIFKLFNVYILTLLLHDYDIISHYRIFLCQDTSLKMVEKGRNMYEDFHMFVYYCI